MKLKDFLGRYWDPDHMVSSVVLKWRSFGGENHEKRLTYEDVGMNKKNFHGFDNKEVMSFRLNPNNELVIVVDMRS